MKEQQVNLMDLTDEELMEMTGGASFVDVVGRIGRIILLYGIRPFPFSN